MAIFRFFKMAAASLCQIWSKLVETPMAAVRHLEFVMHVWGPPTKAFGGLYHCAKFGWNRCSSFENMDVFPISRVWLENAYSRPKIEGFGVFDPLNGEQCEKFRKKGTSLRESASFEPSCVKICCDV